MSDGLACGHTNGLVAAADDDAQTSGIATRNSTDLRRARQHARATVRELEDEIIVFVTEERGITLLASDNPERLNEVITRIAATTFREKLVRWLEQRRLKTMARAIRAAFDLMQKALPGRVTDDEFPGTPTITPRDRALNQELTQIDAGLFYADDGSLSQRVGNRVTRTLRQGFALDETGEQLGERVEEVLTEGENRTSGVSGKTTKSKSQLIAHDSIQDAYITAAHRRYLNNGIRYAVYDATIDFKTSNLCRSLNEVVIDLVDDPILVPPNHPYCRSGLRPLYDLGGRSVVQPDEVRDKYMNTIYRNAAHRPTVLNTEMAYQPNTVTT